MAPLRGLRRPAEVVSGLRPWRGECSWSWGQQPLQARRVGITPAGGSAPGRRPPHQQRPEGPIQIEPQADGLSGCIGPPALEGGVQLELGATTSSGPEGRRNPCRGLGPRSPPTPTSKGPKGRYKSSCKQIGSLPASSFVNQRHISNHIPPRAFLAN